MSGGYFDYAFVELHDFIQKLEYEISNNGKESEGFQTYSPEVIELLQEAIPTLRKAHKIMHLSEYLYSGDIGEETFKDEIVRLIN